MKEQRNPRREAILRTVLDCLIRNDAEEKLTIANVANKLDIGKSTIYEYFENKEALIKGALELVVEQNASILKDWEGFRRASYRGAFFAFIGGLVDSAEENQTLEMLPHHPDVAVLPSSSKRELMEKIRRTIEDIRHRLRAILEKGVTEGILHDAIPDVRRDNIEMMIFGVVMSFSDPNRSLDKKKVIEDLYECVRILHR